MAFHFVSIDFIFYYPVGIFSFSFFLLKINIAAMSPFLYMISGVLYTGSLKHLSRNESAVLESIQLGQILLSCFSKTL